MKTVWLAMAAAAGVAAAAAADDPALAAMYQTRAFNQVAIAPDGQTVAWVHPADNGRLRIYLAGATQGEERRLTADAGVGQYDEKEIHWSPDGTRLAYLCDREQAGQLQLYVRSITGGAETQVTHLRGALTRPQWSPDGRRLSFLFVAGVRGILGAGSPGAEADGLVTDDDFVERVMVVSPGGDEPKPVTPPYQYAFEYDWSPDSREIAYTAASAPGDDTWYHAHLYAVPVDGGPPRDLYQSKLQIAVPRWSPDGQQIGLIEGLMSDKGSTGGDIVIVKLADGTAQNPSFNLKGSAAWIQWFKHSPQVLFGEMVDGGMAVGLLDPATGHAQELWRDFGVIASGEDHLSPKVVDVLSLSVASDESLSAVIRSSVEHPPEVWTGPLGKWTQRTHLNAAVHPPWAKVENVHWRCDRWTEEGWLVYPADYDPSRRYPMIVSIHGGPANQMSVLWPVPTGFDLVALSTRGYFVFCPNPRGSYGQGERYTRANQKDYGPGPLKDVLAGVDEVIATHPVDPDRLGVAGGSYGGYLTMFAVTQTHRFRAAIALAGMSDMFAEYGQTSIEQWMPLYFGATPYDDPAVYRRFSAMTFIHQAATPTLIFAGAGDKECPAAQSTEFWRGLQREGVPAQLVIYSGEGHGPRSRGHITDRMDRVVAWFDRYLK